MAGAEMDYDFGPKRHWRRWVWNRIAERTPTPRDAIALYLAGANDYDRSVALARGFAPSNMIAIERDADALDALRTKGALAISGDAITAVSAFLTKRTADVVFLDMCNGLDKRIARHTVYWLMLPGASRTTFAFNLLRGRDPSSNVMRAGVGAFFDGGPGKHRGENLLGCIFIVCLTSLIRGRAAANGIDISTFERGGDNINDDVAALCNREHARLRALFDGNANAAFGSYRSVANQTFDSLVFRNPFYGGQSHPEFASAAHTLWRGSQESRSISAVMAHRTRRLEQ